MPSAYRPDFTAMRNAKAARDALERQARQELVQALRDLAELLEEGARQDSDMISVASYASTCLRAADALESEV